MAHARPGFIDIRRFLISFVVAAFVSSVVFFELNDIGIVWDEPIHMRNAIQYVAWLKKPTFSEKDAFFRIGEDDVHPPLRKLIAGITHEVLTNDWKIIDNTRGYRISSLLFVFPLILTLTYVSISQFGIAIGILVPLMFSFLPHVLFLTPLLTMDYAVTALWFIAVMAGIKGAKSYWWLLLTGITVGLTMLTKFHGFLLFFPLGGYFIWKRRYIRFGLIAVVACAVYIVGWPWMWTETLAHFGEYLHMQFIHGSVPEYVLGHLYPFAPWWYPTLMFMVTTPVFLLITFFVGAYRTITKGNSFDKIILINALFPILFFSLPGVYRYDWVRLFLPAFPFVCLVAGMGIKFLSRKIPVAVFWGLWFVTIFFSVIRIYPWVSSYYNELVGGPAGAASLGFESEYYGNAYLGVLPWMNGHKSDMMCVPFTKHAVDYYQAMGQIEAGVVFGATGDACRYEIILMRQGFIMQDAYISKLVAKRRPVFAVTLDGVSLVGVYDRTGIKN